MGSSGAGSQGNVTTISDLLPGATKGYFIGYLRAMHDLMDTGGFFTNEPFLAHPGEATYAPQNADEIEGIDRIIKRANGLPFTGAPADYIVGRTIIAKGESVIQNELDGLRLNTNPKLTAYWEKRKEAILQEFEEETLPRIEAACDAVGRMGGDSHHFLQARAAEKVMERLIAISAEIYGKDYHNERELQAVALELGVSYAKQEINDADMLRQAGLYKREYEQGRLEDIYKAYKRESDRVVKLLEILGNAVRTGLGAQVSKTQPIYQPSTIAQVAGIALAGAGMASMIYGNSPMQPGSPSPMTSPPQGPVPTYSPGSEVPNFQLEGF